MLGQSEPSRVLHAHEPNYYFLLERTIWRSSIVSTNTERALINAFVTRGLQSHRTHRRCICEYERQRMALHRGCLCPRRGTVALVMRGHHAYQPHRGCSCASPSSAFVRAERRQASQTTPLSERSEVVAFVLSAAKQKQHNQCFCVASNASVLLSFVRSEAETTEGWLCEAERPRRGHPKGLCRQAPEGGQNMALLNKKMALPPY